MTMTNATRRVTNMQRLGSVAFAIIAGTLTATSNASTVTPAVGQEASCYLAGHLDTDRVRADIDYPIRTDRVWYEAIIARLAWELDCERLKGSTKESEPVVRGTLEPPNVEYQGIDADRRSVPLDGWAGRNARQRGR